MQLVNMLVVGDRLLGVDYDGMVWVSDPYKACLSKPEPGLVWREVADLPVPPSPRGKKK